MNRCRLPIIVGVGLLFLVSSGSAQSQRSQPLPSTMLPAGTRRTLRQKPTALQKSGGRELVHCCFH